MTKVAGGQEKAARILLGCGKCFPFVEAIFATGIGAGFDRFSHELVIKMKSVGSLFIGIIKLLILSVSFPAIVGNRQNAQRCNAQSKSATKAIAFLAIVSAFDLVVGSFVADFLHLGAHSKANSATPSIGSIRDHFLSAPDFAFTEFPNSIVSTFFGSDIVQTLSTGISVGIGISVA